MGGHCWWRGGGHHLTKRHTGHVISQLLSEDQKLWLPSPPPEDHSGVEMEQKQLNNICELLALWEMLGY